jgi:hypothetical protein
MTEEFLTSPSEFPSQDADPTDCLDGSTLLIQQEVLRGTKPIAKNSVPSL